MLNKFIALFYISILWALRARSTTAQPQEASSYSAQHEASRATDQSELNFSVALSLQSNAIYSRATGDEDYRPAIIQRDASAKSPITNYSSLTKGLCLSVVLFILSLGYYIHIVTNSYL